MQEDKRQSLPTPTGKEILRSKIDQVFKLITAQNPILKIEDGTDTFSCRILSDASKDKGKKQFVIENLPADKGRHILEYNLKLYVSAYYHEEGLNHTVSFNAKLKNYIIHMGYPALLLGVLPPVREVSNVMMTFPTKDKPVYLEVPIEGAPPQLRVSEFSKNTIKISSPHVEKFFVKSSQIEDIHVQFVDLGEAFVNGVVSNIETGSVEIDIKPASKEAENTINQYLQNEFEESQIDKESPDTAKAPNEDKCIGNILFIDDEPSIHIAMTMLLESLNYKVSIGINGRDGIIQSLSNAPDLILLDIDMPDMSGIQVLKRLRKYSKTIDIPVIMLTGVAELSIVKQAKELGVVGYVKKPYDPKELLHRIEQAFA